MPIGPGTTWWRRLLVAPLLVALIVLGADVAIDDDWISGVSDAGDTGAGFLRAASRGVVDPMPTVPAPVRIRAASVLAPEDRQASDWIVVTPTDRAPPRV